MATRRRGLDEVFHFFISEDEQREIRERRSRGDRHETQRSSVRWSIPVDLDRPLTVSLAADLAFALSGYGREVHVIAAFEAPFEPATGLLWQCTSDPRELWAGVRATPPDASWVLIQPASEIGSLLTDQPSAGTGENAAFLLPVEGAAWGIREALAALRALGPAAQRIRIAALLLSAAGRPAARTLFDELAAAARNDLGCNIEFAGTLRRDSTSFRSLLRGVPLLELDPNARSSKSLERVVAQLLPSSLPAAPPTSPHA